MVKWKFIASGGLAVAALAGCGTVPATGNNQGRAATLSPGATTPPASPVSTATGVKVRSRSAEPTSSAGTRSPAPASDPASQAPSATPTPATGGTGAACTTSAQKGECGPFAYPQIDGTSGNPSVGNNVWAPISGWQSTLYANNPGNWWVIANMPAGNTAVVSYPSSGSNYGRALSSFSSLYSSFSENMNATSATSAWAAYDIWLNGGSNEVMIQHDFADNGACSGPNATFGGSGGVPVQHWYLCQFGSELVWKLTGDEQSGSVDILSMLTWLESHGYLQKNSTLESIGYGWEIASTGGANEKFQVNSYSISAS
jgi:hypothetical protein